MAGGHGMAGGVRVAARRVENTDAAKGAGDADAFVVFVPSGEDTISISHRNGEPEALYFEQPMGDTTLELDDRQHRCAASLGELRMSTMELWHETLGKLFFEE